MSLNDVIARARPEPPANEPSKRLTWDVPVQLHERFTALVRQGGYRRDVLLNGALVALCTALEADLNSPGK